MSSSSSARRYEGVIENKHSTDVESTNQVPASAMSIHLKVRHAPISVECLFSMTLPCGVTPPP
jgi:hypothetical protein